MKHLTKLLDPDIRNEERERNYIVAANQFNINMVKYKWSEAIELINIEAKKSRKITLLSKV
jgi:hypothetical protein